MSGKLVLALQLPLCNLVTLHTLYCFSKLTEANGRHCHALDRLEALRAVAAARQHCIERTPCLEHEGAAMAMTGASCCSNYVEGRAALMLG